MITVYTTTACPRCKILMNYLNEIGRRYEVASLEDPGVLAELRCEGFFGVMAPVIEVSGRYYGPEEFFDGSKLDIEKLKELIT